MIYLTSDLHFNHNKDFIWKTRGFSNITDMNETIIRNWNSIVNYDDDVYILGDLILGDNEAGIKLLKRLNGHLHIILGNHDTKDRTELYRTIGTVHGQGYRLKYDDYRFYLSHYPTLCANHSKSWETTEINLCGHTHTKNKWEHSDVDFIYHVELDCQNMKPISIDNIIKDFKKKYN